ncbi:MAG: hypothetical protein J6B43_12980 [Lachnospiraceae bacterium]|nr:hypothetical protein [Lachnospiraceae bacterium]
MKKKIVSLISALVLTCAMSLNVCAAGSVTAEDVAAAAGEVAVPATEAELTASKQVADSIIVFDESVSGLTTTTLEAAEVLPIAEELAKLNDESAVESVNVVAVVDLQAAAGKVVVKMSVAANETVYALHVTDQGVERIVGSVSGDKVTFEFGSFSPVAIVKVAQKAGDSAPSTNSGSTAATDTAAAATADATAAVAPKTGDMSTMVVIMAVIFMAGAAVSVRMSRKRA